MTVRVEKPTLSRRLRTFFKSIRFRLTLWTAAILVVILLVFSSFVYYRQAQYLTIDARGQLQEQAQRLAPLYRYAGLAEPGLPAAQLPDFSAMNSQVFPPGETMAFIGMDGSTQQKIGGISDSIIQQLLQAWQTTGQSPDPVTYISTPKSGLARLNLKNQTIYLLSPIFDERRQVGLIILGSPIDPRGQLETLLVTLVFPRWAPWQLLCWAVTGWRRVPWRRCTPSPRRRAASAKPTCTSASTWARRTSWASWPIPLTPCWKGCRRPSTASASSPPMPATSCAPR